jgi:tetratricopeptide (TPR) repeat protein
VSNSPFQYARYEKDIEALEAVHPVALYRRLTEQTARRRGGRESKAWTECMDRWTEELGAQEKSAGNVFVNDELFDEAVRCYTRAISLDGKKTVYYTNRALALNKVGRYAEAEADCSHILNKDGKNVKAIYHRALARVGLKQWREADADLKLVLRLNSNNDAAKNLLAIVKPEVAKLPKQKHEDALNF